jgi:hypothetical protein
LTLSKSHFSFSEIAIPGEETPQVAINLSLIPANHPPLPHLMVCSLANCRFPRKTALKPLLRKAVDSNGK